MGTLQYAGVHLRTPLFVVRGHEGCGAVGAALAARRGGSQEASRIALLLDNILPGLRDVPSGLAPAAEIRAAVEANVRWSMHQIVETPEARGRLAEGRMKLVRRRLRNRDRARAVPYRPDQVGLRLARNAVTPSRKSALV